MNSKNILLGAVMAALLGTAVNASALTDTSNFNVTITILKLCDVHTTAPTNMAFATPTDLVTAINQTSTITVKCTPTTTYNIGLSAGTGSGATTSTRKMTGQTTSSYSVPYNLYSDTGRSVNWGNVVGTDTVSGTGSGLAQPFTVYGQVPAASIAAASPQSYLDTITVTLTY